MSRTLRHVAALGLLAVLSGAPAVAVLCAEWCAPTGSGSTAEETPCHGSTSTKPLVTAEQVIDCADHGPVGLQATISVTASRSSNLLAPVAAPPDAIGGAATAGQPAHAIPSRAQSAALPRPASSSLVLRI